VALTGFLVDTSALARAGKPSVRARIEQLGTHCRLYRCAIIDLEVLRSCTTPEDYERRREDRLSGYIDAPITPHVTTRALEVQRLLAASGRHRGPKLPDYIIAACAEVSGATVVHYDSDFDLIAGVTGQPVEWVVPAGSAD